MYRVRMFVGVESNFEKQSSETDDSENMPSYYGEKQTISSFPQQLFRPRSLNPAIHLHTNPGFSENKKGPQGLKSRIPHPPILA